jgi:hypothetical protein
MTSRIKLRGERSIESKLDRLAYELGNDAERLRVDHPNKERLIQRLAEVSVTLGVLARAFGDGQ